MGFSQLFLGFLQSVGFGSGVVFVLLFVIGIRTPRRSQVIVGRRTSR